MRGALLELRTVRLSQPTNVAGILDDCALHAEANPEIRYLLLACVLDSANHSRYAAFAKAARNKDSIEFGEVSKDRR